MEIALSDKIKTLPATSGVYLMKDRVGTIIYVGKAVCLRKRVQSYFRKSPHASSKTDLLVQDIADIDYLETSSEAEALILEASLIKKYAPRYNIDLKDDKSYPFIEITQEDFPRIHVVRPREKNPQSQYFGPYVNASLIREALNILRKIFPFRVCPTCRKQGCLDYHLGLCPAPCLNKITRREYAQNIKNIAMILSGERDALYRKLRRQMEQASQKHQYERAAQIRDQLQAIGALYSGTRDINFYKEAEQLQRVLKLKRSPERIEAFDISNIMGEQAVGSMVSFLNGKPDKAQYRRFRIKEVEGIDDFRMMAEVVRRRYTRLKRERAVFPDLILIDGGKGQLSASVAELQQLDVDVPIVSLAKREEELFVQGRREPIRLPKSSLGLRLVQRIRDEAHRFAVAYHRKLRGRAFEGKSSR